MKRNPFAAVLAAFALLLLVGCAPKPYTMEGSVEVFDDHSYYLSYARFDGKRSHDIELVGDGKHDLAVEVESTSGALDLRIEAPDGKACYTGTDVPTSSFHVVVDGPGTYTLRLEGKAHEGKVSVAWE